MGLPTYTLGVQSSPEKENTQDDGTSARFQKGNLGGRARWEGDV